MPRKILIIVENLPVPFDTRVWQEATTLVQNGYIVSVICPKGKGFTEEREIIEGVNIFRHDLPFEGKAAFGYLREYMKALREETRLAKLIYKEIGFDVIHGCNPPDNIYLVAKKFKKYGVKYVFDHHDICPELFDVKFGRKGLVKKLLYLSQIYLEKKTFKHCTFSFATNESYKEIAVNRGKMTPEKVIVLRSGPKLERIIIKPPLASIKRGRKYMVGYLGVIGAQEGIEYILQAAEYCKEVVGRDDIFWGIVGGGNHLEAMKTMCNEMNLEDCVEFTGRVSDDVMLDYLNTADICVNSDSYNSMNDKSTMNKILEYMALKKPIVQFDLKEGRYSAQEASLYAEHNNARDLADKIIYLLENPDKRKEMGEYGFARIVNELSWEHTSKALLAGYEKLFAGEFEQKRPRIAMIGHKRIPSREGGVEIVVDELATRLVARGYQVDAYNRYERPDAHKKRVKEPKRKLHNGIRVINIKTFRNDKLNAIVYAASATLQAIFGGYDVIHYHAEGPCIMLRIPRLFGIRVVATIHGLDWQRAKWGGFASKMLKFGEKTAAKKANEVIVLSQNVKEYFQSTYRREVNFVPNGVVKLMNQSPCIITERYGLQGNDYILFLARLVPEKGLHYLVDAYNQITSENKTQGKKLVIAGGHGHVSEYAERIRNDVAGNENIIMAGFIHGNELTELCSNAYLFVLPSDIEGMAISLLEAMSYGNCCLVSDIPENAEVVEEAAISFQRGDVADLKEKIEFLLTNPEIVEKYRIGSSDFICKKYDWEEVVEQTVRLYS
jgi:glycosyltransferase involved in cell wall biosynthesis